MTIPAYLNPLIREWGAQWDVPQLQDIVSVEFSDRMTKPYQLDLCNAFAELVMIHAAADRGGENSL